MRIKKLELHNIASIEDAVIDFESKPLSDTDLFLITGTTGAGKTTILDGISLALYNTTPRLVKGISRSEGANNDNLTGDDPRNIMRQNTGYAYSRLHFTGNDLNEYCAEWSVKRGKKGKLDASLSNVIWSVENLTTGEKESRDNSRKYGEVEDIITKAVGLDFNQFCRTTMLAQGEFTEFLKSNEADKAAILEKISGSEIYRKIGIEIYNRFRSAEARLSEEMKKHEQIVVMDDEKRRSTEDELAQIDRLLVEFQPRIESLQRKINWVDGHLAFQKRLSTASEELQRAQAQLQTEEFQTKEKVVSQWKETMDVRQCYRNALAEKRKADAAEERLKGLKSSYTAALGGQKYLYEQQDKLNQQVSDLDKEISALSANLQVYENSQTIIANIRNIVAAQTEMRRKIEARESCEKVEIPNAIEAFEKSKELSLQAQKECDATSAKLEETKKQLEETNLNSLREESDFLKDIQKTKGEIGAHISTIETKQKEIEDCQKELKTSEMEFEKEKSELTRLELEHERRKDTIDRFARLMRSKLSQHLSDEDNLCPVCGQKVSSLKTDALLDKEYEKIENEFLSQKEKVTNLQKEVLQLKNRIDLATKDVESTQKALYAIEQELLKKVSGRDDKDSLLSASAGEINDIISLLSGKIADGLKVEKERDDLQILFNSQYKAGTDAKVKESADKTELEAAQKRLQDLKDDILSKTAAISELKASVIESLDGSLEWENDWCQHPDKFIVELRDKADYYKSLVRKRDTASQQINANRPVLESIRKIVSDILEIKPDWVVGDVISANMPNLQDAWIKLSADVKSENQAYDSSIQGWTQSSDQVRMFLDLHSEYSVERLDELEKISADAHNRDLEYLNGMRNDLSIKSSHHQKVIEEISAHLENRPADLKDDDTMEILVTTKGEFEQNRDEKNVRKGELETEIRNDDEAKRKKGDRTLLDQLTCERDKWSRFNSVYGDAFGSRLSKIAQSYVLGSLLNAANHHLQSMAPRYRLLVTPGTLKLKLEDKYNGYATRSTNSISGGESFLVSLALALALADFGHHLGVSTLFIDEGFGTLSGEALQSAINTLKALHSNAGRQVGIISHREEIRENIPVQIKVNANAGSSASTVEILD